MSVCSCVFVGVCVRVCSDVSRLCVCLSICPGGNGLFLFLTGAYDDKKYHG